MEKATTNYFLVESQKRALIVEAHAQPHTQVTEKIFYGDAKRRVVTQTKTPKSNISYASATSLTQSRNPQIELSQHFPSCGKNTLLNFFPRPNF